MIGHKGTGSKARRAGHHDKSGEERRPPSTLLAVKPLLRRMSIAGILPCGGIDSNSAITCTTCVTPETVMRSGNT